MKINDVEKQLGITKANIRFYEKEGLLTPGRSANGYRDYTEADIARLKDIIILRKLGIPVQQAADILDGVQPMQEALEGNTDKLRQEIQKLNGSLALCLRILREDAKTLDTERYWKIIHEQEAQGFQFQSLADDYIQFLMPILQEWKPWDVPESAWKNPFRFLAYLLISCGLLAGIGAIGNAQSPDIPFFPAFAEQFGARILLFLSIAFLLSALMIPVFLLCRRYPKLLKTVKEYLPLFLVFTILFLSFAGIVYLLYADFHTFSQAVP